MLFKRMALGAVDAIDSLCLKSLTNPAMILLHFCLERTVTCVRYSNKGISTLLLIYKSWLSVNRALAIVATALPIMDLAWLKINCPLWSKEIQTPKYLIEAL